MWFEQCEGIVIVEGGDGEVGNNPVVVLTVPSAEGVTRANRISRRCHHHTRTSGRLLDNVYDWNAAEFCHEAFSADDGAFMPVILECFQCGRPDWMERILFEEKLERTVHIIMIDYLTAEKYAEDFHCLQSLTRSAKVQKVNFMPGFN